MELRLPVLNWIGPYTPALGSQLWERYALEQLEEAQLLELIVKALIQQREGFRNCKYDGQNKPEG